MNLADLHMHKLFDRLSYLQHKMMARQGRFFLRDPQPIEIRTGRALVRKGLAVERFDATTERIRFEVPIAIYAAHHKWSGGRWKDVGAALAGGKE
jgi:hypothetical protein